MANATDVVPALRAAARAAYSNHNARDEVASCTDIPWWSARLLEPGLFNRLARVAPWRRKR